MSYLAQLEDLKKGCKIKLTIRHLEANFFKDVT